MKNSRPLLLILVWLTASFLGAAGQESMVIRDLHLWTGVKIEKSFSKDWTLSFEEEVRFKSNISELNNFFSELELRYRINKNFALGTAFRFTSDKNDAQGFDPFMRYHFDLRYRGKLSIITLSYRFRYQRETEGMNLFDSNAINEKLFRHRLGLKLNNLDPLAPFVTGELIHEISPYMIPMPRYYRIVIGATFDAGDIGEIKAGWGFNREFGQLVNRMVYMLRLNYTYKF